MLRHGPLASSYRLQLTPAFRFDDAARLLPYLIELGITDCYVSPILKATPGSMHGYDTCDYRELSPELGGAAAFERLAAALQDAGMGLIVDFVPNHMGLDVNANRWWRDVLKRGRHSPFATFLDIDWNPLTPELRDRVLLPILEDPYGDVLHRGEIRLTADDEEGVVVTYFEQRLPLSPESIASLLTPSPSSASHEATASIVDGMNGVPGQPDTFDRLHALLDQQHYRLAHWKTSFDEINYRRFFDVNQLGAIRMELPQVFAETHRKIFDLVARGQITGLRIDHPDGLLDPETYFVRIQEAVGAAAAPASGDTSPFHVVAEKILARGELLPAAWAIAGTTGYGFLNDVNGLFVDPTHERALRRTYAHVSGHRESFADVAYRSRQLVSGSSLASELSVLAQRLKAIADTDRRTRDFTLTALRRAIAEVVACMPVYRTYINDDGFSATDRDHIDRAIDRARRRSPVLPPAVFLFLRQILLTEGDASAEPVRACRQFAMRLQQFSAPIQAKGIEDTAFYRDQVLISLNEVGGDPSRFGSTVDHFHDGNRVRLERWWHEMTTTATHDTKRGEDTRARLNVLTEMPLEWRRAVAEWRRINASRRTAVDCEPAPDGNDEYLFYQALLGAWPLEADLTNVPTEADRELIVRLKTFMLKAVREAKTHTSWLNQNRAYEDAVGLFVDTTLGGGGAQRFLAAFVPFARQIASAGIVNSLAQLVLKIGSPGVPDFYRATELWQFDFADPDNRRDVDFARHQAMLEEMRPWLTCLEKAPGNVQLERYVQDLLKTPSDDRIKLFVTAAGLRLRRRRRDLFVNGAYEVLRAEGPGAPHLVAFARTLGDLRAVVVAPRLLATLTKTTAERGLSCPWTGTTVLLPSSFGDRTLTHRFTGATITPAAGVIDAAELFRVSPVAILT